MPERRFDPLRGEWVAYASERNDRTFRPTLNCPICPSGPGGGSEAPVADFEIAVFENRFPALGGDRVEGRPPRPAGAGCEVVVYTTGHDLTLSQLPVDRVRLLVEVWADRYRELGARPEVEYVYVFENKGEEMGVTMSHPHGQIYALPFVPPIPAAELRLSGLALVETGICLHCAEIARELSGPRLLFEAAGMVAFVPRAARWPYEVHVYPRRHVGSIADLHRDEQEGLAAALLRVAGGYDRHFGFSTPYLMAAHQAPTDGGAWPQAHLHFEFYPPHRRRDRLKQLAGIEIGAGTFVNDSRPEATAAELRSASVRSARP